MESSDTDASIINANSIARAGFTVTYIVLCNEEKKEEIWLSLMTKAPTPTEKSKKQRDNTKTPPKTSITQRLRTDLRRSVWVTGVFKPVYEIML